MPNVMAALPSIGGALCSTPQSRKVWLDVGRPTNRTILCRLQAIFIITRGRHRFTGYHLHTVIRAVRACSCRTRGRNRAVQTDRLVCLSVKLVYCGQTDGWIKMPLGTEVHLSAQATLCQMGICLPHGKGCSLFMRFPPYFYFRFVRIGAIVGRHLSPFLQSLAPDIASLDSYGLV